MTTFGKYLGAVARVENFLANLEHAKGLDQEQVYSVHSIPDGEPGVLLASDLRALLTELRVLTDSEALQVVKLEAENKRLLASLEHYDAAAFDAVLAERDKLQAALAELNSAITWGTSCLKCASDLDAAYDQTVRAEKAEAELERAKPVLDALGRWRDTIDHPATEALAYAYDAFADGPGGCAGHTQKPSASTMHVGRSWTGHEIEDECPCPQAPCGLVDTGTTDPACPQHSLKAAKSTRQSHWANRCPELRAGHTKAVASDAQRYPYADCDDDEPHDSHVWGDPKHWCAGLPAVPVFCMPCQSLMRAEMAAEHRLTAEHRVCVEAYRDYKIARDATEGLSSTDATAVSRD